MNSVLATLNLGAAGIHGSCSTRLACALQREPCNSKLPDPMKDRQRTAQPACGLSAGLLCTAKPLYQAVGARQHGTDLMKKKQKHTLRAAGAMLSDHARVWSRTTSRRRHMKALQREHTAIILGL